MLLAWKTAGAIVVFEFNEAGRVQITSPGVEVVIAAIAVPIPALFVVPAWIGAEQHAARLEGCIQLA